MPDPLPDNPNPNPNPEPDKGPKPDVTDWKTGLDPDIASHPSMADFKSFGDVAKSWVNVQNLIGKDKIPIPVGDGDEAWGVVYDRLGRPKTPEEYVTETPAQLPEGYAIDPKVEKEFRAEAHKLGLSAKAVKGLYSWFIAGQSKEFSDTIAAANLEVQGNKEASEAELKKEWGMAYDSKIGEAQSLITSFADEKDLAALQQIGNNPAIIRFLAKVAGSLGEDVLKRGEGGRSALLTPESAQAEIARMMGDAKNPYWIKNHPEHALAIARMKDLNAMAYGTTK